MENNKTAMELLIEAKKHGYDTMDSKIERGLRILDPSKQDNWINDVIMDTKGCFCGSITENALEILEAIYERKTKEEIEEIVNRQHDLIKQGVQDIVDKYSLFLNRELSLNEIAKLRKQKN